MDAEFFRSLPKVELHAHINASVGKKTSKKLLQNKNAGDPKLAYGEHDRVSLDDSFNVFKIIHSLSTTTETAVCAVPAKNSPTYPPSCCKR